MKITIGIPVYNQGQYIREAIESALNQTLPCEIIVCNDGSTDGSGEIAKNYPVKLINQVNKGLASARNTIIMNMTGDYLLPLDADDILLPNCVEKIIETINATDADIVAPSFKCFGVGSNDVILGDPVLEDFKTANRVAYFSAIRKDALLEIGGYNPKMVFGYEDYDIWFDLLKRNKKLKTIKDILVLYRTKEVSMWTEAVKHHEELLEQIRINHKELFV